MGKAVVSADNHIHAHKGSVERLYDCLDVLKWVFETALANSIPDVFILGDLLQDRVKIHTLAYHGVFSLFKKYAVEEGLKVHLLLGNHDCWQNNNWDVNTVAPLGSLPNVRVIDRPCSYEVQGRMIDWMPYAKDPARHLLGLGKGDLLLGHLSIAEAQYSINRTQWSDLPVECETDMEKLEVERLNRWKKVILGHIHMAQNIGNVEYLGSPLELRSDECGVEKHIGILDLDTLAIDYVANDFSPRHLLVHESDIEKADLDNNFVTVIVEDAGHTSISDLKQRVNATAMPRKLEFVEAPKAQDLSGDPDVKLDISDKNVLRQWVQKNGNKGLDEDRLVELAERLCQEA